MMLEDIRRADWLPATHQRIEPLDGLRREHRTLVQRYADARGAHGEVMSGEPISEAVVASMMAARAACRREQEALTALCDFGLRAVAALVDARGELERVWRGARVVPLGADLEREPRGGEPPEPVVGLSVYQRDHDSRALRALLLALDGFSAAGGDPQGPARIVAGVEAVRCEGARPVTVWRSHPLLASWLEGAEAVPALDALRREHGELLAAVAQARSERAAVADRHVAEDRASRAAAVAAARGEDVAHPDVTPPMVREAHAQVAAEREGVALLAMCAFAERAVDELRAHGTALERAAGAGDEACAALLAGLDDGAHELAADVAAVRAHGERLAAAVGAPA